MSLPRCLRAMRFLPHCMPVNATVRDNISTYRCSIRKLLCLRTSAAVISVRARRRSAGETRTLAFVPYQAFQAADDFLILAIGNDGQWRRFCETADVSAWAADTRFATNPQRVVHRNVLIPMMKTLIRRKTVAEWLQLCADADVPAGPVNTLDKVFGDSQALARGMLVEMPHPTAGTVRLAGTPLNLSTTPAQMRLPPPTWDSTRTKFSRNYLN